MARPQSKVLTAVEAKALKKTLKTTTTDQAGIKKAAEKTIKAAKAAHDDAVKTAKKTMAIAAAASDAATKEAAKVLLGVEKAQGKIIAVANRELAKANGQLEALATTAAAKQEVATA